MQPHKKINRKAQNCQKLIFDFPDLAKSATKKISISNFIKGLLSSAVSKNCMQKISQFWRKVFEKSRKMQKKSQKNFKKITKFPFFTCFFENWPLLLWTYLNAAVIFFLISLPKKITRKQLFGAKKIFGGKKFFKILFLVKLYIEPFLACRPSFECSTKS